MGLNRWIVAMEIVSDLSAKGVDIGTNNGHLRYRAPEGVLNDRLRRVLTEYKPEILDLLRLHPELAVPGSVTVHSFVFNPFRTNCYVCHNAGRAVIIDPGCVTATEQQQILEYLSGNRLRVEHVVVTHGHVDHFCGAGFLSGYFNVPVSLHPADIPALEDRRQFSLVSLDFEVPQPGHFLADGDEIRFGSARLRVMHLPGHSAGSICLHDDENRFVITGDVLFRGAIGSKLISAEGVRQLLASIQNRLWPLDDETVVLPGHGPRTTIGDERRRIERHETEAE